MCVFFLLQLIKFITSLTPKEKAIVFVGRKSMVDFLSVEMLEENLSVSKAVLLLQLCIKNGYCGHMSCSTYHSIPLTLEFTLLSKISLDNGPDFS